MELSWYEDFLELVATRNFLAAAEARNISQPAFSRHIIALEDWMGVQLIDRRTYPVKLTKAGKLILPRCRDIVRDIYRIRTDCHQHADGDKNLISIAALHTIALFFIPNWIEELEQTFGNIHLNMHMDSFYECIEQLAMGRCDFMIAYSHISGPPILRDSTFESLKIGEDVQVLVSGIDAQGAPIYGIPSPDKPKTPYLAYSWDDGFIGKLLSVVHSNQEISKSLTTVYETSVAEGIKRMAIAGRGIGWLPLSCAVDAIERGELCQIGSDELTNSMDICIFRRKGNNEGVLGLFWDNIIANSPYLQPV